MASTGLYTSLGYDNTDSLTNALTPQAVVVATVPSPSSSPLPATIPIPGTLTFPLFPTPTAVPLTAVLINNAPFMVNLFAKVRTSIASAANLGTSSAASVTITSMSIGTTSIAFTSSDTVNQGSPSRRELEQLLLPRGLQAATTFGFTLMGNSNSAAALQASLANPQVAREVIQPVANAIATVADGSDIFARTEVAEVVATTAILESVQGAFRSTVTPPSTTTGGSGGGGGGGSSSSGGGGSGGDNPVPPPSWPSAPPQPATPGASAPLAITVQLDNIPAAFVAFGALTSYGLSALTDAIASSVSAACPACTTRITQVRDTTSGAVLFRAVRRLQGTSSLFVDYTVTVPTGVSASQIACSASSTGAISSALANKGMAGVKAQISSCGSTYEGIGGPLTGGEIAAIAICAIAAVGGVYVLANRERLCGRRGGKAAEQGGDVALPVGGYSASIYADFSLGDTAASSSRPRAAVGGAGRSPVPSPTALSATPPVAVGGAGRSPVPSPTALSATAPAPAARAPPSPPSQSATSAATMDSRAVLRLLSPTVFRMCVDAGPLLPPGPHFSFSLTHMYTSAQAHTYIVLTL
jgi:hypothetical protein